MRKERVGGGQTNHPSRQGLEATTRVVGSRSSSRASSRQSRISRPPSVESRSSSRGSMRGSMRGGDGGLMMNTTIGGGYGAGGNNNNNNNNNNRTMSQGSNTMPGHWNNNPGNTGLPPNYQQGSVAVLPASRQRPPLASPRPLLGPDGGSTVKDRVLRTILQRSGNTAAYVRPAGHYMNKSQELFDIQLEEDLHDVNELHKQSLHPTDPDALIAKEIDARATQAGNFLKLNKKLSIPKEYYDPRYEKMPEDSVVDELVQSRNFVGRMRAMRMQRARILLNSSEGVQACVSPRDGYVRKEKNIYYEADYPQYLVYMSCILFNFEPF